jgi:uncharacterized membrane protein
MNWVEILVIVLVSLYVLGMIILVIYNKKHHKPSLLSDCDCQNVGKEMLAEYKYQKKKKARMQRKEERK